jgi:hypothetical protein
VDVSGLDAIVGEVVQCSKGCGKDVLDRHQLLAMSVRPFTMKNAYTNHRSVDKGILKVRIPSQQLLSEERSVGHVTKQSGTNGIARQIRKLKH